MVVDFTNGLSLRAMNIISKRNALQWTFALLLWRHVEDWQSVICLWRATSSLWLVEKKRQTISRLIWLSHRQDKKPIEHNDRYYSRLESEKSSVHSSDSQSAIHISRLIVCFFFSINQSEQLLSTDRWLIVNLQHVFRVEKSKGPL